MSSVIQSQNILNDYARTLVRVKAKQVVRRPGFNRSEQEDIEQELSVQLLCQAQNFDPERASLHTFIARVVDSTVAMLVRERGQAKRNPGDEGEVQSLTDQVPQANDPPELLGRLISQADLERRTGGASLTPAEHFELSADIQCVVANLPPELQQVCHSLMSRNQEETGEALELSRRAIDAAMLAIRSHFHNSGLAKN
jgi:RNA polymerase sigma-70 factor (ECF subfamily)